MTRIIFIEKRFGKLSRAIIDIANMIIDEYQQQGLSLSLRQLYYQMVARDYIENSEASYKRIGNIVSDARNAGLIDWDAIEDRGRSAYLPTAWTNPAEIVQAAARSFRINRWEGQTNHVEVMVEKDALSGVLQPLCSRYHVRFSANKGYSSSTMLFEAGQRIRSLITDHEGSINQFYILYCGDHDPSGIDMTRDVRERVILYSGLRDLVDNMEIGVDVEDIIHVRRLALNWDQIKQWNPPPNPAKETDSRFAAYREEFGDDSFELDAVEPRNLRDLVEEEIKDLIDRKAWDKAVKKESIMKKELEEFSNSYGKKKPVTKKGAK